MSSVIEQEPNADGLEPDEAIPRVTPLIPPRNWSSELDDGLPTLTPPTAATDEDVFWSTPPRYSLFVSLAPAPLAEAPSPLHARGARLLFATISCVVVALLVLELRAPAAQAPSTPTPASRVSVSNSP